MSRQQRVRMGSALVELLQERPTLGQPTQRRIRAQCHPVQKRCTVGNIADLERIVTMPQKTAVLSRCRLFGSQKWTVEVKRGVRKTVRRPHALQDRTQCR